MTLAAFADVETILHDMLGDLGEVVSKTRDDVQDHLPTIKVVRVGGGDTVITDIARVEIGAYAATADAAWALAEQIRARMLDVQAWTYRIDRGRTDAGPHEIPEANPDMVQVAATYRLSLRRTA